MVAGSLTWHDCAMCRDLSSVYILSVYNIYYTVIHRIFTTESLQNNLITVCYHSHTSHKAMDGMLCSAHTIYPLHTNQWQGALPKHTPTTHFKQSLWESCATLPQTVLLQRYMQTKHSAYMLHVKCTAWHITCHLIYHRWSTEKANLPWVT